MSFNISDYKLKHIISLKEGLISPKYIDVPVEGKNYQFKIENVLSEIIELIVYFKYGEVKLALGPLERELKNYTYGKSRGELSDHEVYEIRFSKFKMSIEGVPHEFEISGVGPSALKVSLYLRYDTIEEEKTSVDKTLKNLILREYKDLILNNVSYQEKLKEITAEYNKKKGEQEKIREEVRREQEEKERKMRELEERLNSNKPKNRPFKMY